MPLYFSCLFLITLSYNMLFNHSVLSFHSSSHIIKHMKYETTMATATFQNSKNIIPMKPVLTQTLNHKIKSNVPIFSIPASTDRRKLSYLTIENKHNSAVGVKVRSQYIKSRLLTGSEQMLAGKTSAIGKKIELIRNSLRSDLNHEPTIEEWAAKCNLTVSQLEKVISTSSQARNVLVTHNMRLVDFIVRGILETSPKATKSLSYFELVTEGIIGLTQAAEHYDGRSSFSTYATFFIKSSVHKCISRLQPGTLVNHDTAMLYSKMKRVAYNFKEKFNRDPTDEEICKELNWTMQYLIALRNRATKKLTSAEKDIASQNFKSSQNSLTNAFTQNYFDLDLVNPSQEGDNTQKLIWKTNFKTALNILKPYERRVLGLRFGFIDGVSRTIPLTAELMCVTEESIRLTTLKAFEKLKSFQLSNEILLNGQPDVESSSLTGKITATLY